jgi:hypothetical protein
MRWAGAWTGTACSTGTVLEPAPNKGRAGLSGGCCTKLSTKFWGFKIEGLSLWMNCLAASQYPLTYFYLYYFGWILIHILV